MLFYAAQSVAVDARLLPSGNVFKIKICRPGSTRVFLIRYSPLPKIINVLPS